MMDEMCGMPPMPANVAPPLKSISTKLSWSGEWLSAKDNTSVRNTSDLPEPVAPTRHTVRPHTVLTHFLDVEICGAGVVVQVR